MRLAWYSSTPECTSGYGNATRNMVRWLQRQGHFVAVATKHPLNVRFRVWDDNIAIVDGTNIEVFNKGIMDSWEIDACVTFFDIWALQKPITRHMASWIPVDTENINEKIFKAVKDVPIKIAMTEHGKKELERFGVTPMYAPIGFDPAIFYPKPEAGRAFRESLVFPGHKVSPDDMFLIGSVGINYPGDRKGFIPLMQAFREFSKTHNNARLFLHTTAHKEQNGHNYAAIAMSLGIGDLVAWPEQNRFWYGLYDEEVLSEIYSGFDVFCLPTKGEGFGMPAVEAQACGTPVIVTDNTSGKQLCKNGYLIETHWDDMDYINDNVWRICPRASEVLACLELANRERGNQFSREVVAGMVSEYQWQNVWDNYWTPIMERIENEVMAYADNN